MALTIEHAEPRRLTRAEYDRMAELGFFQGERVELIHGTVVRMTPIGPRHCDPLDLLLRLFVRALGERARVRIQAPYLAADDSEPEPDLAVVPEQRYVAAHPDRAHLVIEVSETSLAYDRTTKAPLYAASNVAEYWIVDVTARVIEVHREPAGGRYAKTLRVGIGESVAPEAFPDVVVSVDALFG